MTQPVLNIIGERAALGPLRRDLVPLYHRWRNDFTIQRTFGEIPRPTGEEERAAWYDRNVNADNHYVFTIYERDGLRPIGTTNLFDIDWLNRTATYGIMIGEADARGKGYGTEVTRLMLDYGFTALRLISIGLDVDAYNIAGRRAYQRAGFKEMGRRRARTVIGDTRYDLIYMDCLAEEFSGPSVIAPLVLPD